MKKKILLVTAFVLYSVVSICQNKLPPYYQIKDDTTHQYNIPDSFIRVPADKGGNLTINDILTPAFNNKFYVLIENDKAKSS